MSVNSLDREEHAKCALVGQAISLAIKKETSVLELVTAMKTTAKI